MCRGIFGLFSFFLYYHLFVGFRHIFASNCIKWGFDIKALSELLGHSNVEITLNLYVHSSFEQKRVYMNQVSLNF